MAGGQYDITVLNKGAGYGIVIGLGVIFALVILIAIKLQKDYLAEDSGKSEMFMVANRSVGTGLTCAAVFSSWMWINETVFASVQCYKFGIAAPVWFGSGLAFQISLMAMLGVMVKIRIPHAHTSLEIVRLRYGKAGHFTFIILNLINNVVGCASMIVTGSQLLVGMSGIHLAAATILIPLGVVLYTAVGGLKATFLTDFLHTTIALIIIIYFTLSVATHKEVGGLGGLYDKVMASAGQNYIKGNYEGSLLSFKSKGAILFGIILKMGNLALVVMDTAFWQKSFASEVRSTVPGYNLAALAIFAVPWALGSVMGLTARALQYTPAIPFLPEGFSTAQVTAGYVMPYTVHALLGTGGSVAMLLLLFMSVTSTVSSSMIAVSSILSFDIYRTYVNPQATDRQVVRASHLGVLFHGCFITGITLALNYGGADMNWLSYTMNMLQCPGIIPLIFTVLWDRQSKVAAVVAPAVGMASGIAVWIGTTYAIYGEVSLTTTGLAAPTLYGSLTALFLPGILSVAISYLGPKEVFDWKDFLRIGLVGEEGGYKEEHELHPSQEKTEDFKKDIDVDVEPAGASSSGTETPPDEDKIATEPKSAKGPRPAEPRLHNEHPFDGPTLAYLHRWYKVAWIFLGFIIAITWVVWPLPLYRDYIFTKTFFKGWVSVAIIWQFFALLVVVVYPIYDGSGEIMKTVRGLQGRWFGGNRA